MPWPLPMIAEFTASPLPMMAEFTASPLPMLAEFTAPGFFPQFEMLRKALSQIFSLLDSTSVTRSELTWGKSGLEKAIDWCFASRKQNKLLLSLGGLTAQGTAKPGLSALKKAEEPGLKSAHCAL